MRRQHTVQRDHSLRWWQQPLAILGNHYDFGQKGATRHPTIERDPATIERIVRWKRKAGFDTEFLMLNHSYFKGTGGDDGRSYYFKNFHGYSADWLGQYLPIAHKHGLRVVVYFNCHWLKFDAFPADHFVVDAAGKPKVIYGDGGEICCRGPFRAWSERMAEDLGKYPVDGVFLDGPVKDACWCPHCRAAFQTRFGQALPDKPSDLSVSMQAEYEAFLTDMPVGYIEAFERGLRKHNADATLSCNGGDHRQMKATLPWTQVLGDEGGFVGYGPLTGEFPFGAGLAAKVMEHRACGRARVVFCDCGFKVYDWYIHPPGEIARMLAGTIANGASPWITAYGSAANVPGTQMLFRFNRIIAKQREALTNGESIAEAAILQSPLNQRLAGTVHAASGDDVHKREASAQRLAVPRHTEEFQGIYAAFARSGYPFDVVEDDVLLEGRLPSRIKLLVLPGVGAVSDKLADWLRTFVTNGGRLLATFDTSLFDEHGNRRKDFALADVFGAHLEGELQGPSNLDYMGFERSNALTADLSQNLLPRPEHWWHMNAGRSAKPLLWYHEKMPRRYAAMPAISRQPAALLNRFGKGSVIFISSTIGQLSLRYRLPDIRLLLRNAACSLATPPVTVEGGDEFIETTLRRSPTGTIAIHLINWAAGERPASKAIPLGPLRVSVHLPKGTRSPKSVRLAMAERNVRVAVSGGIATFTIPRIAEYELAVLK